MNSINSAGGDSGFSAVYPGVEVTTGGICGRRGTKQNQAKDEAAKMLTYLKDRASRLGTTLEEISDTSELVVCLDDADGPGTLPRLYQLRFNKEVIGGVGILHQTRDDLDLDQMELAAGVVIEREVVVVVFGVTIMYCAQTEGEPPELETFTGFYEAMKDQGFSLLIAEVLRHTSSQLYLMYTGEEDDGAEGGPAYQFADWLLGSRGRGKAV